METKVAIGQRPPVLLDKAASLPAAVVAVAETVSLGAYLITFPEPFLPGCPTWIWRLRPGADMALGNEIHSKLRVSAANIAAVELAPLAGAAPMRKMN